MDKELINNKIEDLEAELQKLKQLANTPEQRTPEAGDVWCVDGYDYHVGYGRRATSLKHGNPLNDPLEEYFASSKCTYLGKFDEVYVKISDVRKALSFKDSEKAAKTLRKLKITD